MKKPPRPVIPYLGSKFRIAPKIIAAFPPHQIYVEAFGGAANILLAKPPVINEVYNDLNDELVNLFTVIRNHPSKLIRALRRTPYAEKEYLAAYAAAKNPVERARRLFLRCHASFHPVFAFHRKNAYFSAHRCLKNPSAAKRYQAVVRMLPQVVARLRNVTITHTPAIKLIRQFNDPRVLIYADPPYVPSTRSSIAKYKNEMTIDDHAELLDSLKLIKSAVVISGYSHPLYNKALKNWQQIVIPSQTFNITNSATLTKEILWIKR